MLLQLLLFIHNQKGNRNIDFSLAMALDMDIVHCIDMAMAIAKSSSHLEIGWFLYLELFIHNQKDDKTIDFSLAMALDMDIAYCMDMAMAMAKA